MPRSSFGVANQAASGYGDGVARLNQKNLGGLAGGQVDNRRSYGGGVNSEVGSVYRGGGDDDAYSQFMGASELGGQEMGVGSSAFAVGAPGNLKPPTSQSGKR